MIPLLNSADDLLFPPDATDWRILDVLRRHGRMGYAEPARAVPEILEAHHVTGDDCLVPFVLKDAARSMKHLEEVSGRIGALGAVTTDVVYSAPLARRPVSR
ncbi:Lrp/AsnC ligand binding domain-containing protein [Streptomyces libani]|uniref:Lrp/AsnC ligand binding domain-containing protein n=1 Tax=Streptomyces nigrescens TaxID=1920 RepID=UPI00303F19C4